MPAESAGITIKSIDGNKVPRTTRFNVTTSSGLLLDTAAFADALAAVYDAVIQGQIVDMGVDYRLRVPGGLKAAPVSGSNNTVGALLEYATAVPLEMASLWAPSWIPAGFEAAHQNQVDIANGSVAAFLAFMLATTSNTVVTDGDGNAITALSRAVKSDRKQRKALGRLR